MSSAAVNLLASGEVDSALVMMEKLEIRLAHLASLREELLRSLQGLRRKSA